MALLSMNSDLFGSFEFPGRLHPMNIYQVGATKISLSFSDAATGDSR